MTNQTAKHLSQSDIAIQIERLVNAVIRHDCPAFRISYDAQGDEVIERTRLSRYFDHIRQMYHLVHDEKYALSEHLLAFKEACYDIGIEFGMFGMTCMDESEGGLLSEAQTYNWLVERIRAHVQTKWFKRGKSDRAYREKGNRQTVTEYVEQVMDSRSRTVLVRVDLYYREAARARLTVEEVFEDLDRLIRAREYDPVFQHETGYICAVEQGENMGYHIHAAFFFDGREVRSDYAKAEAIGELWERTTKGWGYSHSCNHDKAQYKERCGVGMIKRNDDAGRQNVIHACHYLTEEGQSLQVKPIGARALRLGNTRRLIG
ncbi:TPA: inovirus-type Gp2 protein [Pseudomonas aeruginosa]|uniref:YagK/YfjJ domain-containing protein n=1 Tax=Pseudomonas aeruginosa TaxID=287 RepID=UPI000DECE64D|nr:inovirus-type Gp2 protein [Pseudomonas aeruginosa]ELB6588381.1 inovirus-type Gp2 protein [Pseudomonas aeruginosa]ELB6590331.1 inovirus-type Gp2 protein [Pseudomonas aeruginosa]ELK4934450.1 inovirus-type Gp2 protein [Pseudomonas aeruginosa]MCL8372140.1 inovirus Gp2 family protein [Pseudomonas aeruginosa]RCI53443.1 inovirus Gp2 family protein [Pseudomonas aeruginosa]